MISSTEENYLKTILYLERKLGDATSNELSKALGIRMSTVSSMMKRLADKGFVIYEIYKPIQLTDLGRKEAGLILRKHRLTEMFLFEVMEIGWEDVHNIAEQIEHIQSLIFFDRMDELLGYPDIDPHGSPIPDKEGNLPIQNEPSLSECEIGDKVTICAIKDSTKDLLLYLSKREIDLGTTISVVAIEKYDGCMTVSYNDRMEILSKLVCDNLLVSQNA